jgi:S1-C subfamily serine protease
MLDAVHPQHSYTLEIRYVHRAPEVRRIEAGRVVIGRDGGDIVLGDPQASAAHAELEFENGQLIVRDLGSSNGTWIGDRQLPQFALSPGQVFRCGHTQIRLLEIVGGQQLIAGRTMISEAGPIMPIQAPPPPSPQPAASAAMPPATGVASAASKPNTGLILAATLGAAVFVGVVGGGAYLVFADDEPEAVASAEPEPAPEPAPTPEPQPPSTPETAAPQDADLGELYRKVGAATVVVRVPGSVGSGAVIDPSGIILTNHHVINAGVRDGLSLKAKVVFGEYSEELRTFEPRHQQLDAWVIKIDEEHDLALLRLIAPPSDLTHITLANENPYPGQRVAAIGHAGVGMLWAIKGGEVSAAGSLSGHAELLLDAHEGDRAYLEQTKKRFEKMGRVIQSTTKILPGDSGGPLVNLASEIVGLNAFGRIDEGTNQWLSFHIHRAEIAAFVAEIPTRPLAVVPDPWDHAGSWTRVEDANLDGKADVLLLSGSVGLGGESSPWGTLIDLDGDSYASDSSPAAVNGRIVEIVEAKRFDAEFAILHEPGGASHYWYDRDGVPGFDLYLVDEHGLGKPSAWSLDVHGGAEKLEGLELGTGLRPELFQKPELADAFRTIGSVVFPGQIEAGAATHEGLPKPTHQTEGKVAFADGNHDGLNDTVIEQSAFDQRVFIDLDQNSVGRTTSVEALKVLLSVATLDAELAMINQGVSAWVWYDRDDDGRFDLVLRSHDVASGVAHEAYSLPVAATDAPITAPEHIGRRLLRPALFAKPELGSLLAANERSLWTAPRDADGIASFPALARSDAATIVIQDKVAFVTDLGEDLTLVDIDGDSSADSVAAAATLVRAGQYDAEFALLRRGGVEWAFYDRDGDGRLDWVLISLDAARGVVTHVYEITGTTATARPEIAGGTLINWGSFTNTTLRNNFADIAPVHWPERARER